MPDQDVDPGERLRALVRKIDTAMLVTYAGSRLRARPMAVQRGDSQDVLYFATDLESAKVTEILVNPRAHAIFQDGSRFVFLTGHVNLSKDRALIDRLWAEDWKIWFPEGKDDPALCLLRFDVEEGEYWDEGGTNAIKYLFKTARAYVKGEKPKEDETEYGKARLGSANLQKR